MISKIIQMIIQEAKSRPHQHLSNSLQDVHHEVSKIILRLASHIEGISNLDIPDEQQRMFIEHLINRPIY